MNSGNDDGALVVPERTVLDACEERPFSELGVVEQVWDTDPVPVEEIAVWCADAISLLPFDGVPDGGEVALGVGSRGIANLAAVVSGVVDAVQDAGYQPFVFPR